MHHRIATLSTLTGLALALCLQGTSPALAQATKERECETVDLTTTEEQPPLSSPCLESDIVLSSGELTACVLTVIDPQGRAHEKVTVHGRGEGVDAFGNTYRFVLELPAQGNESLDETGAAEATGVVVIHLNGQGNAPDVKCHAVVHVTRNANDETTVTFEKIAEGCECQPPTP